MRKIIGKRKTYKNEVKERDSTFEENYL